MNNKAQLQISFGWLFAIIVGIAILGFAFWFSYKIIDTEDEVTSAEKGKEIEILANSFETGFESGKSTYLELGIETRIRNTCGLKGEFGEQELLIAQKSFNKWNPVEFETNIENRYIFSDTEVQGEEFYLFSKPFYLPFKVSDLVYLTSVEDKYCFISSPSKINDEINQINQNNLNTACSINDIRVCFNNGEECDIKVNTEKKKVEKDGEVMYYEGEALMYGAIFSDKETYECQVKRLMKRVSELCDIYQGKSWLIQDKGCPSDEVMVSTLAANAEALKTSADLSFVKDTSIDVDYQNKKAICKLW